MKELCGIFRNLVFVGILLNADVKSSELWGSWSAISVLASRDGWM